MTYAQDLAKIEGDLSATQEGIERLKTELPARLAKLVGFSTTGAAAGSTLEKIDRAAELAKIKADPKFAPQIRDDDGNWKEATVATFIKAAHRLQLGTPLFGDASKAAPRSDAALEKMAKDPHFPLQELGADGAWKTNEAATLVKAAHRMRLGEPLVGKAVDASVPPGALGGGRFVGFSK